MCVYIYVSMYVYVCVCVKVCSYTKVYSLHIFIIHAHKFNLRKFISLYITYQKFKIIHSTLLKSKTKILVKRSRQPSMKD